MALIETTTPLKAEATYTSETKTLARAVEITGSVYADEAGTLHVEQSGDGTDFDVDSTFEIKAKEGVGFDIKIVDPYFRLRYVNGTTEQKEFRLFGNARDLYGAFLPSPKAPSAGGPYVVLYYNPEKAAYQVVGRFEGEEAYQANAAAAIYQKQNGKYASFAVTSASVSEEKLATTTEEIPASF